MIQQREKAWFASSPKSRLQYLGPTPGLPSLGDQSSEVPTSLDPSAGPVSAYCLLLLDPDQVQIIFCSYIYLYVIYSTHYNCKNLFCTQVDYVNLKSNERLAFSRKNINEESCWSSDRVNP